ncbi:MAG: hypothetical protein IT282_13785 [Bacteroidetes bacterium]|nr:hypothetical protein [Bacteroidota bacterium]
MKTTRIAVALSLMVLAASAQAQTGGEPGAFSRMGFGARGMGMGNAMTAMTRGDIVAYYNPALLPSAEYRHASASFGILSLDRRLNFISYTQALPPKAGLSVGLINAGVTEIDGRDGDGRQTGALRTSENQVFLGFAIRVAPDLQIGVSLKLYYYQLYTDVSSTTIGIDAGMLYHLGEGFAAALTVRDVNSRYKWDTSPLYGQSGQTSEDRFPVLTTAGLSYILPDSIASAAAEVEMSNRSTFILRAGVEVPLLSAFALRAGIDRVDLKESGNGVRPSIGFTARTTVGGWTPALHYAFVLEPFAPTALHMITLSAAL